MEYRGNHDKNQIQTREDHDTDIDRAIYESEKEYRKTNKTIDLDDTIDRLNKKYYGI